MASTTTSTTDSGARYSRVAMALHWTIAVLILLQIGLGWYMNKVLPDHSPAQQNIVHLHISIGLTTLLFVLARIIWRLTHRPPAPAAGLATWERLLASAIHGLLYVLMLALPLTGWAMVSVRKTAAFTMWGIPWPHFPGVAALAGANPKPLHEAIQSVHTDWLVWIILASLALHVAGAIKHQFDGHPVLRRMTPGPN